MPDDDLDTIFPTFHLQVTCWKESLELNPSVAARSAPPPSRSAVLPPRSRGCLEKPQKVEVVGGSPSSDKWLVTFTGGRFINGVGWVELSAAGRMGEAACQPPGIALSSFPAGLMRQGVKKHHGKDLQSPHTSGR